MIFKAFLKNKIARSNFMEIMSIDIEGKKYIDELESRLEEHEVTIDKWKVMSMIKLMRLRTSPKLLNLHKSPRNLLRRLLI